MTIRRLEEEKLPLGLFNIFQDDRKWRWGNSTKIPVMKSN